ncbi:Protein of unknown function (DUF3040) [Streptoalloteichus tenebrarius]|uniref:DUF3040 domain-containing protein n=1 Tax=Streptoalloteichus tenebrarius (strain ATCC 17920 / DSM 40477 / JCM 4838 / CBS 697.72 / NBRC 16177 / NCIMB 11028 / NRRL B-12390 / A12253. 1 / ISP 5477) TaxID=1933 RepID=A0ABT1HYW2_STRSD|nr:DUF3040 domain-containing protein [Streptoalloteichus tenebrarius]MCP2260711.1 Protein of unknown function (DUF3040) [Streptoalloteichus tenebrarius]BFF03755.1 hypothetical protein GCM10020241_54300 [Streptoalloteichus tenebrarius]
MLSREERRQLAEIERWLEQDDPVLAQGLRDGLPPRVGRMGAWFVRVLFGVGLLLFVVGVLAANALSVLGGACAVGGALALLGLARDRNRGGRPGVA